MRWIGVAVVALLNVCLLAQLTTAASRPRFLSRDLFVRSFGEHWYNELGRQVAEQATRSTSFASSDDDIDFKGIVKDELERRKDNLTDKCEDCIIPLAVPVCKQAWEKLLEYCSKKHDAKSDETCEHYKANPKDFIVNRVLRAGMNPIDAGYSVCWWKGKCK